MSKQRRLSLNGYIWLMITGITVIFALIFGHIIYHVTLDEIAEQLAEEHQSIVQNPQAIHYLGNKDDVRHWLVTQEAQRVTVVAANTTHHGKYRAYQLTHYLEEVTLWPHMQQTWLGKGNRRLLISYLPQEGQYLVSRLYQPVGLLVPLLGLLLIVMLMGMAYSALTRRYVIKPIHHLVAYAGHIAKRQWQPPPDGSYHAAEIGELIDAMNNMQQQLKQNQEEQQAFLQSISHDLKTPVAVIIGHAQGIVDGVYVDSAENNAEIIKEEALRLEQKIKKILYYNTLDYTLANDDECTSVDVAQLLGELKIRFQAISQHLDWQLVTEPALIMADEENLRIALENIIDNALRYAKTTIMLKVEVIAHQMIITIENDGEPIAPERLERIFDQLSKGKNGNFGLGLFISRKIICYYQGDIAAQNTASGVCFSITLPLNTP